MATLNGRLIKLEKLFGRDSAATTRLIWVAVREIIGPRSEHESFWSLLEFESHGRMQRPQGVSEALLNEWQRRGDLVVLLLDPEHCRGEKLPFGDWPTNEVIQDCIERNRLCEWRHYQRGSLWKQYQKVYPERILQ